MKKIALVFLIFLLPFLVAAESPPMPDKSDLLEVTCVKVVDGDTAWFEESSALVVHKVRFIGVDTPETVHPTKGVEAGGKEASAYTTNALLNKRAWLEYDQDPYDRYGRHLCYVWLEDGSLFNLTLVQSGHAKAKEYPPNTKYQDYFEDAEKSK